MTPYWTSKDGQIYQGNVLDVLKGLPAESVHMCVTSPPYWGLRSYGTPDQIWDEVECVSELSGIKQGCNHVWGDVEGTNTHRDEDERLKNVQRAKTKGYDVGGWGANEHASKHIQRSGTVNSQFCQRCNAWKGSLGLEPTPELFIKHMVQIFAEVKRVLRKDGTCWVNMGDSYAGSGKATGQNQDGDNWKNCKQSTSRGSAIGEMGPKMNLPTGLKPKDLCGIPWRLALALQADGWWLRQDIIWEKPNPMPEPVTDRCTKAHEYIFLLTKSAKYYYDADAIKEKQAETEYTKSRYKYKPSAGNYSKKSNPDTNWSGGELSNNFGNGTRNKRSVWKIPTEPTPEAHFATFPKKLVEPCILAGTSEKGCCEDCGAPWVRVVENKYTGNLDAPKAMQKGQAEYAGGNKNPSGFKHCHATKESKTTGWKPGCDCNADTTPCVVADIFFGSGKTGLVAYKHGRKFVGIELSKTYLDDIAIPKIKAERKQRKLF